MTSPMLADYPDATLAVSLPDGTAARATVYDVLGRAVQVSDLAPGAGSLAVEGGSLPAGVYTVRVVAGDGSAPVVRRLTVAR